jgi:hypothetical protein
MKNTDREWITRTINLKMSVEGIEQSVEVICYGDVAMHQIGDFLNVVHWPSGRRLWLSEHHRRFVMASIKRISPLFDDMPNKECPSGQDPAYKAWWDRVKDKVLNEWKKFSA